jgi:hypothetical protein
MNNIQVKTEPHLPTGWLLPGGALFIVALIVSMPDLIFSPKRAWIPLAGVFPPNLGPVTPVI